MKMEAERQYELYDKIVELHEESIKIADNVGIPLRAIDFTRDYCDFLLKFKDVGRLKALYSVLEQRINNISKVTSLSSSQPLCEALKILQKMQDLVVLEQLQV
jgi:hypothetical protein